MSLPHPKANVSTWFSKSGFVLSPGSTTSSRVNFKCEYYFQQRENEGVLPLLKEQCVGPVRLATILSILLNRMSETRSQFPTKPAAIDLYHSIIRIGKMNLRASTIFDRP